MRYPTLSSAQTEDLVQQLVRGESTSAFTLALWKGHGETIDFEPLEEVVEDFQDLLITFREDPSANSDKDLFEGTLAVAVFPFFNSIPIEVLDDPGFWRYLAIQYFWWFASWRESGPIASGNAAAYTNASLNSEHIPLRLYLRAKAVKVEDNDVSLTAGLRHGSDFWRSHILRVRTGTAPKLTRALVEMQNDNERRLATDPLRSYARRLNRVWTNVNLNLLDEAQTKELIEELRD
jgi:hypothetical protein